MIGRALFISVVLIVTSRGSNELEDSQEQLLGILLASFTPNKNILRTDETKINNVSLYDHSRLVRKKLLEKNLLESQQKRKRDEIMQFLTKNYQTTNYFYNELKRIQRTRTPKDRLRQMVEYLDIPENWQAKLSVLHHYNLYRSKKKPIIDPYAHKLNHLVINIMKDPFNDGVH